MDRAAIPVNPQLPEGFDCTPNSERPESHDQWWFKPFIVTVGFSGDESQRSRWMNAWPAGTRFDVRMLDGGAWDRSTCKGNFSSLDEALSYAMNLAEQYQDCGKLDIPVV